jgi:hypothetical protein
MRVEGFLAAALLVGSLASATASTSDFLQAFMGAKPGDKDDFACFGRAYDAQHLGAHPRQNVASIYVLAIRRADVKDGVGFNAGARLRGGEARLEFWGGCEAADAKSLVGKTSVRCNVNCEGDDVEVTLNSNGSVLLQIPDAGRWSNPEIKNGDPNHCGAGFGSDDKVFRLDRVPLSDCVWLADDEGDRDEMRRSR